MSASVNKSAIMAIVLAGLTELQQQRCIKTNNKNVEMPPLQTDAAQMPRAVVCSSNIQILCKRFYKYI